MTRLETQKTARTPLQLWRVTLSTHGESHYKNIRQKKNGKFNLPFLAFAFFSEQQDRGLLDAISRDLLDCPCRF